MNESERTPAVTRATVMPLPDEERRRKRRVKVAQPVKVRPSHPGDTHFEEVIATLNVCRDGLYFPTRSDSYYKGMRLFVTFPYSDAPDAVNLEYVGQVVRIDKLPHGEFGIAVHLLGSINLLGR